MITRYGHVDEDAIRTDRTRQLASRAEYDPDTTTAAEWRSDLQRCACGRLTQSPTGECPGCRRKP